LDVSLPLSPYPDWRSPGRADIEDRPKEGEAGCPGGPEWEALSRIQKELLKRAQQVCLYIAVNLYGVSI